MEGLSIQIINTSSNPLPEYATAGSSGMDIRAFLEEPITLKPLERKLIPTGLFVEIPEGFEAQIRPRSGLAYKQGITCLNTPGTIDSDYRGEIKVLLVNLGDSPQAIQNGDRVAQMVIARVERVQLMERGELNSSERGSGGFGHTGMQ